jgi:hypothetical protein
MLIGPTTISVEKMAIRGLFIKLLLQLFISWLIS